MKHDQVEVQRLQQAQPEQSGTVSAGAIAQRRLALHQLLEELTQKRQSGDDETEELVPRAVITPLQKEIDEQEVLIKVRKADSSICMRIGFGQRDRRL